MNPATLVSLNMRELDRLKVTSSQSQALLSLLDRPEQDNPGLKNLFSRRAPWNT